MCPLRVEVIRSPPRDRDRFEHLVGSLSVTIKSVSHLHVGSGRYALQTNEKELVESLKKYKGLTEEAIRSVVFEEGYLSFSAAGNTPLIPASSVKGNVRSRIELSFKARGGKVRSCFIRATGPTPPPAKGMHGWRHHKIWGDVLSEDRGRACDLTAGTQVCLVCDLFGTSGLQGLVSFSDFVGSGVRLGRLSLDYGVNVLAAPPNSTFNGRIDFLNLRPEELGLLFIGMGLRDSVRGREVLLGRFKYRKQVRGYKLGRVVYQVEELRLSEFSEPLEVNGISLEPRQTFRGEALGELVKALVTKALDSYKGELDIRDEVSAIEELQ